MTFERVIELLHEFNYKKNGRLATIQFLIYILNELANGGE